MNNYVFYFISGLGADERAFKFLSINTNHVVYINWVKPLKKETLGGYCDRIVQQIDFDCNKKIVLIGVSFGGIVAQELAKKIDCHQVIIISSVKSCEELPLSFRILQRIKLYRLVPAPFFKYVNDRFARYLFSIENQTEAKLLEEIIKDTDPHFLKWAIDKIFCWKSEELPRNLFHIHGEDDKIFPIANISNALKVKGGHFMIVNKANEISLIINTQLSIA